MVEYCLNVFQEETFIYLKHCSCLLLAVACPIKPFFLFSLKLFQIDSKIMVASSFENGSIFFWDLRSSKVLMQNKIHSEPGKKFLQ